MTDILTTEPRPLDRSDAWIEREMQRIVAADMERAIRYEWPDPQADDKTARRIEAELSEHA